MLRVQDRCILLRNNDLKDVTEHDFLERNNKQSLFLIQRVSCLGTDQITTHGVLGAYNESEMSMSSLRTTTTTITDTTTVTY